VAPDRGVAGARSPRYNVIQRITWYAADALGSLRRTFNGASATPLGIVNYDPWGTPESGSVPTSGRLDPFNSIGTMRIGVR